MPNNSNHSLIEKIDYDHNKDFKYFSYLCTISVTLLCIALVFTYRLIDIGPFLLPSGVFVFPLTYIIADITAEVYGYKNAKLLIWGNILTIIVFSLSCFLLLKYSHASSLKVNDAYHIILGHHFRLTMAYILGFSIGDFINAYAISKWKILLNGKYFMLRSIGASIIGQSIFTIIASSIIYSSTLNFFELIHQIISVISFKAIIILLCAYPSTLIMIYLKKISGVFFTKQIQI